MNADEYKQRIAGALQRNAERGGAGNYAVPASAGGASDWDAAVDAFARHININPSVLPIKTRQQWCRVLERVGNLWGAGPSVMLEVIRKIPDSPLAWKTWSNPYQAEADLGALIGQHLSGGISNSQPTNKQKLAAAFERLTGEVF